jgi:hypothetical protein
MNEKLESNRSKMQEAIGMAALFLPESEVKNAQHFLDHDEIGIAFQELCGSICEGSLVISDALKMKLLTLYEDLDGDSEDFWQEINLKTHILNMKVA